MSGSKDYWEHRLKSNYGLHGTGFIGRGRHYNNWMYKVRKTVFLSRMKTHLQIDFSKCSVLDIGSGTGFYIDLWKRLGVKKITGSDITSVATENLKIKYPHDQIYELDITENIDSLVERFDVVSAIDVLFHITDDTKYKRAISNIYSLLNPGGFFVFSENFTQEAGTIRSLQQVTRTLDFTKEVLAETRFKTLQRSPMFVIMNSPVDSKSVVLREGWNLASSLIRFNTNAGLIIGALLYPIELLLVFSKKESPTTEMMICEK